MVFSDSGVLDALAGTVTDAAERVRAAQSALRDRAVAMSWRSPAARSAQHAVTAVLHRQLAASTRLEELAGGLRAHRRRVDLLAGELDALGDAARSVVALLGGGRR